MWYTFKSAMLRWRQPVWTRIVALGVTLAAAGPSCNSATANSEPRYDLQLTATRWFGRVGRFTFAGDSAGIVLGGVLPTVVPCLVFNGWGTVAGSRVTIFVRSIQNPATVACQQVLAAFQLNGRLNGLTPGDYTVVLQYGDAYDGTLSPFTPVDSGVVTVR